MFILWDVISGSQELSRTIATSLSHLAVHNPIPNWDVLISGVAFPYSPPEINRGPVYEFHLNHVLVPDTPTPCSAPNTRNCDHGDGWRACKLVRSKNAGPFWPTIEIIFDDADGYRGVRDAEIVNRAAIARLCNRNRADIIIVNHDAALAIKVSRPRPQSSGSQARQRRPRRPAIRTTARPESRRVGAEQPGNA